MEENIQDLRIKKKKNAKEYKQREFWKCKN